jgi:trans-aconitate 2-methyltransferase
VSTEWNAAQYHQVSEPQFQWGLAVLARLPLNGGERAIDAGCGSGRLTAKLLERLPRGHVMAVDRSVNMLEKAREHLAPLAGPRVSIVQADVAALPFTAAADVVFSTATFHWIRDHDALFRSVHRSLKAGGVLHAQCGGGPNLERIQTRARSLMSDPAFAPHFGGWREQTYYASADGTRARLTAAGFDSVHTDLEPAPVTFPSAEDFAAFIAVVVLRTHLEPLPHHLRHAFLARIVEQARRDDPPFTLDYWRLNMSGRRA